MIVYTIIDIIPHFLSNLPIHLLPEASFTPSSVISNMPIENVFRQEFIKLVSKLKENQFWKQVDGDDQISIMIMDNDEDDAIIMAVMTTILDPNFNMPIEYV